MRPRALLCLLLPLLWTSAAHSQPSVRVVAKTTADSSFKAKSIQAQLGETVELGVRLLKKRRLLPLPDGAQVQWIQVVPRMQHRDTPARNNGNRIYSNSIMFGPKHGRWLGADTLEYDEVPLKARPGATTKGASLKLSTAHGSRFGGLGTIFIAAEVTLPGKDGVRVTLRTPDASTVNALGLTPKVMRVSFRQDDTFVGWLGSLFHVPYVFGSTGPQTERYTGTDCADAMVRAYRAAKRPSANYTSVSGLATYTKSLSGVLNLDEHGTIRDEKGSSVVLRWGEHVRPGDLFTMDFTSDTAVKMLPRAWDHVAALVEDNTSNAQGAGVLDSTDSVRHMTTLGLIDEPLSSMGKIRLRFWRWR